VVRINGDSLEFREKGSRRTFRLPLEHAARQAVLHTAEALPILQPITINLGPLPEGLKPEPDPIPAPAASEQQALL
jgi:hypothetical protein